MSGDKQHVVYWDSCIFIAAFKGELKEASIVEGVKQQAAQLESKAIHLATSTITILEVLSTKDQNDAHKTFLEQFDRPNFHLINVTRQVAELAHDIRKYHWQNVSEKNRIADAIQLASAIDFEANCLYTFDAHMLNIQGLICGKHKLRIEVPTPLAPSLFVNSADKEMMHNPFAPTGI